MFIFGRKRRSVSIDHSLTELTINEISPSSLASSEASGPKDENEEDRKKRMKSLWTAYGTMFIMTIGFSIVISGVWNYMNELDPSIDSKIYLGWVVASNPLGQMIASPLIGFWGNKRGSIRLPCIIMVFLFMAGNILYGLLYAFQDINGNNLSYEMMILSRTVVGISSGSVTLCRSYVASATTIDERTSSMSIMAASQALGYVLGPALQSMLAVLIPEDILFDVPWFVWNMYTACGWLAAALGILNLFILLPCFFKEYYITERHSSQSMEEHYKIPAIPIIGVLFCFFSSQFLYIMIETLLTPLVIDQYAWDQEKALIIVGIALSIGGLITSMMYIVVSYAGKYFEDRKLILFAGLIPLTLGALLFIPWQGDPIGHPECYYDNTKSSYIYVTTEGTNLNSITLQANRLLSFYRGLSKDYLYSIWAYDTAMDEDCFGCQPEQEWCDYIPPLPYFQLVLASLILVLALPAAMALSPVIISKLLGPHPKGVWMGIITGVGSLARIVGPILGTYIYANFGTRWTFGMAAILIAFTSIEIGILYSKLKPLSR